MTEGIFHYVKKQFNMEGRKFFEKIGNFHDVKSSNGIFHDTMSTGYSLIVRMLVQGDVTT